MNYFELFNIPETFYPDQSNLKRKFYELSRKYHPDFFAGYSEDKQAEVLEMSSLLNKAYKVLQDRDAAIKYLLQLKGLLEEDEKYQLPPKFLMEVMELNEELMEAKMDEDKNKLEAIGHKIEQLQNAIYQPVKPIVDGYKMNDASDEALLRVKRYYFEKKYLDRILAAM